MESKIRSRSAPRRASPEHLPSLGEALYIRTRGLLVLIFSESPRLDRRNSRLSLLALRRTRPTPTVVLNHSWSSHLLGQDNVGALRTSSRPHRHSNQLIPRGPPGPSPTRRFRAALFRIQNTHPSPRRSPRRHSPFTQSPPKSIPTRISLLFHLRQRPTRATSRNTFRRQSAQLAMPDLRSRHLHPSTALALQGHHGIHDRSGLFDP
jgi:hypothetical protein